MTVTSFTHLVRYEGGQVRPLCEDFGRSPNWTIYRSVVTCPQCVTRLRAIPDEASVSSDPPTDAEA